MATMSYKCPNCDGPLKFNPDKQTFTCEYCLGEFRPEQVQQMNEQKEQRETYDEREVKRAEQEKAQAQAQGAEESDEYPVSYSCPSCGAEIVTTSTTAATTCFYCYNPVVLGGRLSNEFKPDRVVPFELSKEKAVERFLPSAGIHVRVVSDFKTEIDEELGGTIPQMIDRMREIFLQNNGKGSARPEITDFSLESLDELLFNALIHRDYTMGVPTEILVDPEGVEIKSPGGLFNQASPEKLLYANSISRNPVLGRALRMLGFCTMNGNGIREIFYSALKYGRPEPDYSQSSEKQVSVFLHRIQPDLALSSLIEKVLLNGSRLSVTALRVLYQLRRTPLTAEEIAERLSLSSGGRLVVVLENLLSLKLAEFTEGGRYQIMWPAADDDI